MTKKHNRRSSKIFRKLLSNNRRIREKAMSFKILKKLRKKALHRGLIRRKKKNLHSLLRMNKRKLSKKKPKPKQIEETFWFLMRSKKQTKCRNLRIKTSRSEKWLQLVPLNFNQEMRF